MKIKLLILLGASARIEVAESSDFLTFLRKKALLARLRRGPKTPAPTMAPTKEPTKAPTAIPTSQTVLEPAPTPNPTTTSPTTTSPTTTKPTTASPMLQAAPGYLSGVFGDPHLSTFDELRFDCQASGEFIMVKSMENPNFSIQERFTDVGSAASTGCSQASVSTGIAIAEDALPTIQLSIPRGNTQDRRSVVVGGDDGCPVDLFIGGTQTSLSAGSSVNGVDIIVDDDVVWVYYTATGVRVTTTVRNAASTFGCYFLVQVFLPYGYRANETIIGLLGTPNARSNDDWVAKNGTILTPPANQNQGSFRQAYDYCTTNWCIKNRADSLFSYKSGAGESFASISGCNITYDNQIETLVTNPGADLVSICGSNIFCLVDGICGNLNDARNAITDEIFIETQQNKTNIVDLNDVITCISVIDETDLPSALVTSEWTLFRRSYPKRPFCLLQPEPNPPSDLLIPGLFNNDNLTTFSAVKRDNGDVNTTSDWFSICGLAGQVSKGITEAALFIDNSGSMSTSQVQASYDLFLERIKKEGMKIVAGIENTDENWIRPFLTDF